MADEGATPRTVVAAFDFDRTLTTRDSVVPFVLAAVGRRRLAVQLARSPLQVATALVRRDRDGLRAVGTRAFAGCPVDEVASVAAAFAADALAAALRPDTVARLRSHVAAGHRVVIVSASYEEYLRPIAADLGVEAVLSSRLAIADGRCTGLLEGANCRAAEKVRRVEAWLDAEGLRRDGVVVYAYGDSAGDRELLSWADHATWIGREPISASFAG